MNNFFDFIKRYSFSALFILLEIIAFSLTANRRSRERAFFINSSNSLFSSFYTNFYKINSYFRLKDINEALFNENINLKKNCHKQSNATEAQSNLDSSQYKYIGGRVVKNSILSENNFLTIDKGSKDGIRKEMGVISPKGVVGIVVNVSRHYCIVLSVLNKLNGIACKLKKSDYFGTASWQGEDYRFVTLEGIPNHVKIKKGDSVVTSGYSTYFPPGILVGTIVSYKKQIDNNFYKIKLKLSVDFKDITTVYLIKNNLSVEQLKLEKNTKEILE